MSLLNRFVFICSLSLFALGTGTSLAQAAPIADKGDFVVAYPQPKKAEYRALQTEFKDGKVLESMAEGLNDAFALPRDITLEFKELGEANAYYDPNTRHISLGYELIEDLRELFAKTSKDEDVVLDRTINATMFILCHELGHALIDVCDLPAVGKEEDAVDQLSFIMLSDSEDPNDKTNDNNKMVLDGAQAFLLLANRDETTLEQMSLWDDHSLSKQRFYNILSLIYGSNPKKYAYMVQRKTLPADRAEGSEEEYARVSRAWGRLLAPYIKE
ncbi:hypothetical protein IAD21_03960 [Abditibacteriota bacterium]|nr:hypothetical protein IAD21_03960 [Abditibacteriota bacterium]